MENMRILAAFALLAHLVMLSYGNLNERNGVEEIISKSVPIIVIEKNSDSLLEMEIRNITSLSADNLNNTNENNSSDVSIVKNEKILEEELSEEMKNAAGEIILVSSSASRINESEQFPVIIIENSAVNSEDITKSPLAKETIEDLRTSLDQEGSQSQNYASYADRDNLENIQDLLAIAEYEPQRIDTKRSENDNTNILNDETNSRQTTRHPLIEEMHYDVPKRRNLRKSPQTISDATTQNPSLKISSTINEPLVTPLNPDSVKTEQKNSEVQRSQFSSTPSFYPKLAAVYTNSVRDRRHPKIELSPIPQSSLRRKLTYLVPKRNTLVSNEPPLSTSTIVPDLPKIVKSSKNFINSSKVEKAPTQLTSPSTSILENQTFISPHKSINSIPPTFSPQANRRIDYYLTPEYVESSKPTKRPLSNEELGFLTRYNLPSLVPGKLKPSASQYRQSKRILETDEEKEKSEEKNLPKTTDFRRSRTPIIVRDNHRTEARKNYGRSPGIDYREEQKAPDGQISSSYDFQEEEIRIPSNHRSQNTAYQHSGKQELQKKRGVPNNHRLRNTASVSPTSLHKSRGNSVEPKLVLHSQFASTTPVYDYYEDSKESVGNAKAFKNLPVESYEDYKESLENPKTIKNLPAPSYEDYKEFSEIPKTAKNLPIASYENYKDSSENSKIPKHLPDASYEDYKESEEKSKTVRNEPAESEEKPKIVRNAPIDSYEDYRESTIANERKNLKQPIVSTESAYDSYEDYRETTERKIIPKQQISNPTNRNQFQRQPINSQPPLNYLNIQPVTPVNLLDNPIYKLHGLKSNSVPVNSYTNKPTRNSLQLDSLDKQNIQVPRAKLNNQRILSTTVAYEDSVETEFPSRATNSNYIKHRFSRPIDNKDKNIRRPLIIPVENNKSENRFDEFSEKPISSSPSQAKYQHRNNLQRARKVSPTENFESNEHGRSIDQRSFSPDTRKQRVSNNQQIRFGASPTYETRIHDDQEINASPSVRPKLIEPHLADYGNRIKTRVVEKQRVVEPSLKTANRRKYGNYEDRRPVDKHVDEVPVESVNRADVRESDHYEDEVPAGSGHDEKHENYETHEEAKKPEGGEHEEGGGDKHEEGHYEHHGDKGDKGYKSWHEHDKGEKGHHDKESHDKEYDEKKGEKKKHEEESDYHKEHHHEEKGDKEAQFGEKGEHQKGHSTKGQHVVHKKDEYEKKTEFYDESHEEDGEEKEGGYGEEHESEKGGHEKIGHHDSAHHEDKYGKKGEHEKGHHYHENKGHKNSDGHDEHHHHEEKYGKKGGHEEGKKWSHKKGDNEKKDS